MTERVTGRVTDRDVLNAIAALRNEIEHLRGRLDRVIGDHALDHSARLNMVERRLDVLDTNNRRARR